MSEEFKAVGSIAVVPGVVIDETGAPVREDVRIQILGGCAPLQHTREGLAQLQSLLLDAAATLGRAMISAPAAAEADRAPAVQIATAMPDLGRMRIRGNPRGN